ncbi:MAG: hypothetical protein HY816_19205 [Candidatus Wallbacteria bacterium]|nr:hypothetical protein [Candidatus Wallbacteria bacterium]
MCLIALLALAGGTGGCGKPEVPSPRPVVEEIVRDMQERAFDRLYGRLTAARKRELTLEEYVRTNLAGFEKLESAGGALEDWQMREETRSGDGTQAWIETVVRVTFPGKAGPSEHRRRLVFQLNYEEDEWKFDSYRSYEVP